MQFLRSDHFLDAPERTVKAGFCFMGSTLVANHLECIATSPAAGTDPSTARASWFHVDCAAFPIASRRAYDPLFSELNFAGSCIDLQFV